MGNNEECNSKFFINIFKQFAEYPGICCIERTGRFISYNH